MTKRIKWGLPLGTSVGALLLLLFALAAIFGPLLAPYDPAAQNLDQLLQGPSRRHWLGTDENGCDVLSMLLWGARLAALLSVATTAVCLAIGLLLGTLAGYLGGWWDEVIMRVVDVLLAFPGILLNLAIVAIVPSAGVGVFVFALAINGWVGYARVVRAQVLAVRERDFVLASRSLGAAPGFIMRHHIVPHILSPLVVQASFGFAGIILVEASLAFLGLGRIHSYSWGALLAQGTTYLWRAQHLAIPPGVAILVVVLGCNLVGDGLRDRFDSRSR